MLISINTLQYTIIELRTYYSFNDVMATVDAGGFHLSVEGQIESCGRSCQNVVYLVLSGEKSILAGPAYTSTKPGILQPNRLVEPNLYFI